MGQGPRRQGQRDQSLLYALLCRATTVGQSPLPRSHPYYSIYRLGSSLVPTTDITPDTRERDMSLRPLNKLKCLMIQAQQGNASKGVSQRPRRQGQRGWGLLHSVLRWALSGGTPLVPRLHPCFSIHRLSSFLSCLRLTSLPDARERDVWLRPFNKLKCLMIQAPQGNANKGLGQRSQEKGQRGQSMLHALLL